MNAAVRKNHGSKPTKRKKQLVSTVAVAHVTATNNNTIITIADLNGDSLGSSSGGVFQKGSRKATPFAAQEAAKALGQRVKDLGIDEIRVILRGAGAGRDSSVKGLHAAGVKILTIADKTKVPHGGVRKRKKRRV